MEMFNNFYWEYMQGCDNLIARFLTEGKKLNKELFKIQSIDIEKAVANYLWEKLFFSSAKHLYSKERLERKTGEAILNNLWNETLSPLLPISINKITSSYFLDITDPFGEVLNPYKHAILFYSKNNRQLKYLLPILNKIKSKSVVISMMEIEDKIIKNDNVEVIEFDLIFQYILIDQNYLKDKLPYLFFLTNTFFILIKNIKPKNVILLEGCHFEQEIIAAICKVFSIKTICIQQGWPGLMHTRFSKMDYDLFLTWGKKFSELWKKHSPLPEYKETGYLYKVQEAFPANKTAITFFFQSPSFTISKDIFTAMINFALFCASTFIERKILIREHPEYKFTVDVLNAFSKQENVVLVSERELSEVFIETEIGVAIFSSTLVEGLIHGVIPFVFNLTSMPRYYPDVQDAKLGIEVNTFDIACQEMLELISNESYKLQLQINIAKQKHSFFKGADKKAVNNILKLIELT